MNFIKEDLEVMLREHLKNEAKLTEIKLKQEEYEERLRYAGMTFQDSKEDVIEGMQLSGQVLSDIPKSNTNKISDTTYNTVVTYQKEVNYINKEDRVYLEKKIIECEEEKRKLDKAIVRVNNLLTILNQKQRFVIEEFYINSEKGDWKKVEREYRNFISKDLTIKQLQNIRDIAIKDMLEVLNV